jgi:hypothetical protein
MELGGGWVGGGEGREVGKAGMNRFNEGVVELDEGGERVGGQGTTGKQKRKGIRK